MLKTIKCSVFIILLLPCFTNAYALLEDTHVTVTNNTSHPVMIHSELITVDKDFRKGTDWDGLDVTLAPYKSKEVLWFSRSPNLLENVDYQYILNIAQQNSKTDAVIFKSNVKRKRYYGSMMTNELQLPQDVWKPVLQDKGLEHYPTHFWNEDYVVHARRFQPTTNLFSNIHVVVDEKQNTIKQLSHANTLNVLTYNAQLQPFYGNVVNDLNQPTRRELDISTIISGYDVVIFQELFDHTIRLKMITDMSAHYPYHTRVVGDTSSKPWTGGVMIFSKWPMMQEDQIVYKASNGLDSYAAKGVSYALVDKNGKHYHVFGTHLEAGNAVDDVRVRRKQLAEMENFIDNLNIPKEEPVLIGGDMNIDEFSFEAPTLYAMLYADKIENLGYQYSADADVDTMNNGSGRSRLDFVVYDKRHLVPHVATNNVFILRALYDEKMWPKFDLSDHFPVEAHFEF